MLCLTTLSVVYNIYDFGEDSLLALVEDMVYIIQPVWVAYNFLLYGVVMIVCIAMHYPLELAFLIVIILFFDHLLSQPIYPIPVIIHASRVGPNNRNESRFMEVESGKK